MKQREILEQMTEIIRELSQDPDIGAWIEDPCMQEKMQDLIHYADKILYNY